MLFNLANLAQLVKSLFEIIVKTLCQNIPMKVEFDAIRLLVRFNCLLDKSAWVNKFSQANIHKQTNVL